MENAFTKRGIRMKRLLLGNVLVLSLFLFACGADTTTTTALPCDVEFTATMHETIPFVSVTSKTSVLSGDVTGFCRYCRDPETASPLLVSASLRKTHQLVFEMDAIYPMESLVVEGAAGEGFLAPQTVSLDFSLNGFNYERILTDVPLQEGSNVLDCTGHSARYIRLQFPASLGHKYGLQDFRAVLGRGFIVREAPDWSEAFLRHEHWTGADGIFSFNLKGDDAVGASDPITAFVFSDTFVGAVNPVNNLRTSNAMINNSIGYYDGNPKISEGLSFAYDESSGHPKSAFSPDSYLGYQPGNLLDSAGLSAFFSEDATLTDMGAGTMWKTPIHGNDSVTVDLQSLRPIGKLTIWNFNENPDLGAKTIRVSTSADGSGWVDRQTVSLSKSSGSGQAPFTNQIDLRGVTARYLRLEILETYDPDIVGLGKILLRDSEGNPLFGQVSATDFYPALTENESSGRLWLQDGLVAGDSLYLFPLLVKDAPGGSFTVDRVGLIRVPLADGKITFSEAVYLGSPLQSRAENGDLLYFGAGVMDHSSIDGYVYVYGYRDGHGRDLVVARTTAETFEDFNAWNYFDGEGWSRDPNDSAPLLEGVSPELSVTRMTSGMLAGKYMLVAMEGTTSGKISYSVSETPWGPFSSFTLLYETLEGETLQSAFTYNAKMHPHLSTEGSYLISYNVNALQISALVDARIYHPRFITVEEVREP